MKKFWMLALAAAVACSVSAQESVVKEANKALKGGKTFSEVETIITPALTDPSTSGLAETWYIPGKAAFNEFNDLYGKLQLNMLPSNRTTSDMARLLISCYDYYEKALPIDTVFDKKGKPKTKHSKDIVNSLAGLIGDYYNFGGELFNNKDYKNAMRSWEIYTALAKQPQIVPVLEKSKKMPADSMLANASFNKALAASNLEDYPAAVAAFKEAINYGYTKKPLFDHAIIMARVGKLPEDVLFFAEQALPLYGDEDPAYLQEIVNYYLQKKELDKAFEIINKAIEAEPDNAQYYVVQGVLYENKGDNPSAKDAYEKATRLNSKNAMAQFYYGRMIFDEAVKLGEQAPTRQEEYEVFFNEKIKPLFEQSATVIEGAYQLDPENMDALRYLEQIYYQINDGAKLEDVKRRMAL